MEPKTKGKQTVAPLRWCGGFAFVVCFFLCLCVVSVSFFFGSPVGPVAEGKKMALAVFLIVWSSVPVSQYACRLAARRSLSPMQKTPPLLKYKCSLVPSVRSHGFKSSVARAPIFVCFGFVCSLALGPRPAFRSLFPSHPPVRTSCATNINRCFRNETPIRSDTSRECRIPGALPLHPHAIQSPPFPHSPSMLFVLMLLFISPGGVSHFHHHRPLPHPSAALLLPPARRAPRRGRRLLGLGRGLLCCRGLGGLV